MKGTMISDFEHFKIGIGPSNSHVVGRRSRAFSSKATRCGASQLRNGAGSSASPGARLPPSAVICRLLKQVLSDGSRDVRGRYVVPLSEL
jgi:hypothetical protein